MTDGLMEGQTDRGVHNIPIAFFFFFFFFFFLRKKSIGIKPTCYLEL